MHKANVVGKHIYHENSDHIPNNVLIALENAAQFQMSIFDFRTVSVVKILEGLISCIHHIRCAVIDEIASSQT